MTLNAELPERDGLLSRTVHPTTPPQVEYALTALGVSLLAPVSALATWAQENREAVYLARKHYEDQLSSDGKLPLRRDPEGL